MSDTFTIDWLCEEYKDEFEITEDGKMQIGLAVVSFSQDVSQTDRHLPQTALVFKPGAFPVEVRTQEELKNAI